MPQAVNKGLLVMHQAILLSKAHTRLLTKARAKLLAPFRTHAVRHMQACSNTHVTSSSTHAVHVTSSKFQVPSSKFQVPTSWSEVEGSEGCQGLPPMTRKSFHFVCTSTQCPLPSGSEPQIWSCTLHLFPFPFSPRAAFPFSFLGWPCPFYLEIKSELKVKSKSKC